MPNGPYVLTRNQSSRTITVVDSSRQVPCSFSAHHGSDVVHVLNFTGPMTPVQIHSLFLCETAQEESSVVSFPVLWTPRAEHEESAVRSFPRLLGSSSLPSIIHGYGL
ncbi:hypothetical protein WOLCODRAFT_29563 [Wolfiporia cocos MD-104 SS10]|uniref:Uncharacterized protein n=1 Tax=Wolfiporia cocos (strain MD-104) TaxID=742152 RepID=A0A2H3JKV1_WOLCO|nr:hypothetical protein WOLCODRAFT_29563 [Wolfiporia cocos MD-104 SS10]